jgi:hypothetical protein
MSRPAARLREYAIPEAIGFLWELLECAILVRMHVLYNACTTPNPKMARIIVH